MIRSTSYTFAVGVAEGPSSTAALTWASSLAAKCDASITALSAWNYPTPLMMPIVGAPTLPAEFVEAKARQTLTNALAATPTGSVAMREKVIMGAPRSALVEASADHDLLVVGRSGNSRLKQAWLGSTANYCARHAHCPVAIIRAATSVDNQWVVAVDGSDTSIAALTWALKLRGTEGVLAVYSREEWELSGMASDHRIRPEIPQAVHDHLANVIAQAALAASVLPQDVRHEIRRGDPRMTIVDDAKPAELLVFGSHGHSGLVRMLLGSVADYAVHHAQGNVVIWRSGD